MLMLSNCISLDRLEECLIHDPGKEVKREIIVLNKYRLLSQQYGTIPTTGHY